MAVFVTGNKFLLSNAAIFKTNRHVEGEDDHISFHFLSILLYYFGSGGIALHQGWGGHALVS